MIDKRKKYILMVDTETANTMCDDTGKLDMSNVLVYDIGMAVIDKKGNIYEKYSFINSDIFYHEKDLMKSAYYAHKIPLYEKAILNGESEVANFYQIRKKMFELLDKYNITTVAAHNSRFDYNACNITQRYITKSKYRYFFPKGIEIWDTMKMANDTICKQTLYKEFCEEHGYKTANNQVRKTAEILYRYITQNVDFEEEHRGLQDVEIEAVILAHCIKQHKKMRKKLFENY